MVWAVVAVGAVVGLVIGWGVFATRRALFPARDPATSAPLGHPTVVLTTPDGTSCPAWRLQTDQPRGRLVICHGYQAGLDQVVGIAEGLRDRGYESLLLELRGHGSRRGPCTMGLKETEDAGLVLAWARSLQGGRRLPVAVLGLSMGAAVACALALRHPDVRAVIADSLYPRLYPVLQEEIIHRYRLPTVPWAWIAWWSLQLALGTRLGPRDPILLGPQLHIPLLLIHGDLDLRVSRQASDALFEQWGGPKERWRNEAVGHVQMWTTNPRGYCDRVAAFLNRVVNPLIRPQESDP